MTSACEICGATFDANDSYSGNQCAACEAKAERPTADLLPREDHACSTGDCDHDKQAECDATLARDYPTAPAPDTFEQARDAAAGEFLEDLINAGKMPRTGRVNFGFKAGADWAYQRGLSESEEKLALALGGIGVDVSGAYDFDGLCKLLKPLVHEVEVEKVTLENDRLTAELAEARELLKTLFDDSEFNWRSAKFRFDRILNERNELRARQERERMDVESRKQPPWPAGKSPLQPLYDEACAKLEAHLSKPASADVFRPSDFAMAVTVGNTTCTIRDEDKHAIAARANRILSERSQVGAK